MKRIGLVMLLGLVLGLAACNSEKKQEETLRKDVERVHDEAMMLMDSIYGLQSRLRRNLNQMKDTTAQGLTARIAIMEALVGLEKADDAMMTWMQEYKGDFQGNHEQIMAYLNAEMERIRKVDTQMRGSISAANAAKK